MFIVAPATPNNGASSPVASHTTSTGSGLPSPEALTILNAHSATFTGLLDSEEVSSQPILPFFLSAHRRPKPQSNHSKHAYALEQNCQAFVERHDLDHCLFMTMTFKYPVWPAVAASHLKKAVRIFPPYFTDWITTWGLGASGRIHFHVLAACQSNVREGFRLSAYRDLLILDHGPEQLISRPEHAAASVASIKRKLRASLSANGELLALRRKLLPRLRKIGFGCQTRLDPIFIDGPTIAAYMRKNYWETVMGGDRAFKGQRLVGYKQGSERLIRLPFAWVGRPEWRIACGRIAEALGVDGYLSMCPTFGPKWGYRIGKLIDRLKAEHGDVPASWPAAAIIALAADTMPKLSEVSQFDEDNDDLAVAA